MTTLTAQTEQPMAWKDSRRHLWLMGLVVPLLPLLSAALVWQTGVSAYWWLTPIMLYVIMPVLDMMVGADSVNPPEAIVAALDNDRYYRWCTFLFIPVQYLTLIVGTWFMVQPGMSLSSLLGLGLSIALINGVGINTAHELGHKRPKLEHWLAKLALAPTGYGHFYVEHNRGHHVRVSTPEDPASSRLGETFWEFLPRSMWGSLSSAWELEAKRLERCGKSTWSLSNENLQSWAMTVVLFGGLTAVLGLKALPFLLIQGFVASALLEVVNYLEHYGLLRQKEANGRYERCRPEHSWNSNAMLSNILLYQLQRHSDHHANPTRRYQSLRHFTEVPQLPTGYLGMILAAYVPPVWRAIMDKRVIAHYNGDLSLINIHPRAKARIYAKYGTPVGA